MRTVVARAPARIDFGGGWTDVPPYPEETGGCVCNAAIDRRVTVRLAAHDDAADVRIDADDDALPRAALHHAGLRGGVALTLRSGFPRGAGLGGSSAAGVAVQAAIAAWRDESLDRVALAERSHAVETGVLHLAGGSQDHYAAAVGGVLGLHFGEHVTVTRIPLTPEQRGALERRCIVVFTGESRLSSDTITAVIDAYRHRDPRVTTALARMKALAGEMITALQRWRPDDLAALVGEHWEHQRALHPRITTPAIERVLDIARRAGATGGKALGASGGGSVLVMAPEEHADAVRDAVSRVAEPLPFALDESGAVSAAEDEA